MMNPSPPLFRAQMNSRFPDERKVARKNGRMEGRKEGRGKKEKPDPLVEFAIVHVASVGRGAARRGRPPGQLHRLGLALPSSPS